MTRARVLAATVLSLAATSLVFAACTGDDATSRVLQLSFDGEACEYEGPMELTAGEVDLMWVNESDEITEFTLLRHVQDQSVDEAIEHYGPSPSNRITPSWAASVVASNRPPGDTYETVATLRAGTYHMTCVVVDPSAPTFWFGAGLLVNE